MIIDTLVAIVIVLVLVLAVLFDDKFKKVELNKKLNTLYEEIEEILSTAKREIELEKVPSILDTISDMEYDRVRFAQVKLRYHIKLKSVRE